MHFTPIFEQEVAQGPVQPAADAPATGAALALALAAIERDSAQASDSYLHDTVVPHGGE